MTTTTATNVDASIKQEETYAFQAEINQLLSLIINAFYSNKDVFMRELISNASDALDKVRYASLTDTSLLDSDATLDIKIIPDKNNRTLTIEDTGIGMSKDELIKNLGTIAHSGTRSFMEALQSGQQPDINLIGQFGVGFYSAYLVADKVSVISKTVNDDVAHVWESNASGSFTIRTATDQENSYTRGTKITLFMKEDHVDYLEENKIKTIVQKHNGYCSFPILLQCTREVEVEQEEGADDVGSDQPEEEGTVVDDNTVNNNITDVKPPKEKIKKTEVEFDKINKQQPIWLRKPEDVTEDEYKAFYKSVTNDWDEPLHYKHFSIDGSVQFKCILYIPRHAPFDMFQSQKEEKKRDNIKLYVKKVLIMDESNDMLPEYLSFVKGVVDSDDLPLNVSREMLQQNSVMKVIKKAMVKKAIEMMTELATSVSEDDKKKWNTFYEAFNKNIKLGVYEDDKNREKLVELLSFKTSKFNGNDDMTNLKQYVGRMRDGQKHIYYVTGESLAAVKSSPFIKKLVKKGFEVLLLVDPIDEYMVQSLREYDGKQMVCCSKDGFEMEKTDDDKKRMEQLVEEWKPVCERIKSLLTGKVVDVRVTDVLDDDVPCVLSSDKYGWTANMERLMKAQALRTNTFMDGARRILEINPGHVIPKEIKTLCVDSTHDNTKKLQRVVDLLYETVIIDSGYSIDEPNKYAQKIYNLIALGLSGGEDNDEDADVGASIDDVVSAPENSNDDVSPLEEVD